jgi:lipopolysaccharide transport system permease protein
MARLLLVIPVFALSGVRPSWSIALFPIGLLSLMMMGFAAGLILAPFGALYRDVVSSVTIALSFLFLITPVAYAVTPDQVPGWARLNPITPVLGTARAWLTGGSAAPVDGWYLAVGFGAATFVLGWLLLRLAVPHLVDRISA